MKKVLSIMFALLCTVIFVSCGSSDDNEKLSSEEQLKKDLIGHWYFSEDNEINSISFDNNGTGTITTYIYSQKQWTSNKGILQYTLLGNVLTVMTKQNDLSSVTSLTIAITGNSMSFIDKDGESAMITKFDGSESKINELKKNIEENWLESEPGGSLSEDNFFNTENDLKLAIQCVYNYIIGFESNQLELENIRLTGKDLRGYDRTITPEINEVKYTWDYAYKAISFANNIIKVLDSYSIQSLSTAEILSYKNEVLALRGFVFMNIGQLWGHVPYVTSTDLDATLNAPIYSLDELYSHILNELASISTITKGDYNITLDDIKAMRAEIMLELNKRPNALSLLENNKANFCIFINSDTEPELFKLYGNKIINYSTDIVNLMEKEASTDWSSLVSDWQSSKVKWGYWDMLRRTGKAQSITGCKDFELLMPIPRAVLDFLPTISQNAGY